jgi:N-methylhydantoinase B
VLGAFARALPELMPAAIGDGGPLINLRTSDPFTGRRLMANLDPITGGSGGVASRDGTEASGGHKGFLKNTPVEINEAEVPVKILKYGLACDSGGAGRWRGGTGTTLRFQVMSPNSVVSARNRDRTRFTPWGVQGGQAGKASLFRRNPDSNREYNLGNTDVVSVDPGDVVEITSAGGGGWGSPLEREPERVLRDVECGFVSVDGARNDYGVVIQEGAVDPEASALERVQLAARLHNAADGFGFNTARREFEQMWSRENYAALMQCLYTLPTDWRFFIKHRFFDVSESEAQEAGRAFTAADIQRMFENIVAGYPELRTRTP